MAKKTIQVAPRPEWTSQVETWRLDAAEEETPQRYYYYREAVDGVVRGRKPIVVGRKGTGKTALVRYVAMQQEQLPNHFVAHFDLQEFGVFGQAATEIDRTKTAADLFSHWQITLLNEVAKLMLHGRIDGGVRQELSKALLQSPAAILQGYSTVAIERRGNISVMGHGLGAAERKQVVFSEMNVADRAREFCDYLCAHIDSSTYFVVIDGIDSNYSAISESLGKKFFLEYASALVRAALRVRRAFQETNRANVFPIVAIRSDIFSELEHADKNKWSDLLVDMRWSTEQLKALADFRVARLQDDRAKHFECGGSFEKLFGNRSIGGKSLFDHACATSLQRPRDIVSFVRHCIRQSSTFPIPNAEVKRIAYDQSVYLRSEIEDEARTQFSDLPGLLNVLEDLGVQEVPSDLLRVKFDSAFGLSHEEVLTAAIRHNVLGVRRTNRNVFAYLDERLRSTGASHYYVHPGLLPALGIEH